MAKTIIKKELKQETDVLETGLMYTEPEETIITIHDKYQSYIDQAKSGYIVGFTYPMAMEVLRYCENKKGIQMGMNMSCGQCLIDLLIMFDRLR